MSLRNRLVEALTALSAIPVATKSGKYLAFKLSDYPDTIFIGKNGAVRVGASASKASVSIPMKRRLLSFNPDELRKGHVQ